MPRNGTKNLIPMNKRTKEEQRKIARMGAKKSKESKKARKTLREELLAILSDGNIQNKISLALIQEAIIGNRAGSVAKAFETIRDTIGEKPTDRIEQMSTNIIVDLSDVEVDNESDDDNNQGTK